MKLTKTKSITLMILAVITIMIACSKKSDEPTKEEAGFDKSAMLVNYADNLIIPSYTNMQTQIGLLEVSLNTFITTPTLNNQTALKAVFKTTYLQFEHISVNQFGPAERVLLNNFLNTFPTNLTTVNANINSGTYDLTLNNTINQQGFPALDYTLFATDALQKFTDVNTAAKRKKYAQDLVTRMKTMVTSVLDTWKNTYRAEFIANTKIDASSPITFLVNQFAFEMDQLKGPRIGWPYGKQSVGGAQTPENTEGYYSGISVALAIENLTNLKTMYTGNASGKGLSDYLIAIHKETLNTSVLNQIDLAIAKLSAIPEPLSLSLSAHKTEIDAAYPEIQRLLTLIKTDVASATGVRISYQDSDND